MPFYAPEYLNIVSESQLLNIINEEYFVNNDLLKIEKLIGELRTKYYNINNKQTAINIDPLIKEISLLFENVFGFNSFQLIVEQKVREPNAYTIPLSSKIDIYNYKKCIKKLIKEFSLLLLQK